MATLIPPSGPVPVKLPASLVWARPTDAVLLRICSSAYVENEPGFRATGAGRFDDTHKRFETLYCAADFETCYSEVMLRDGAFNRAAGQFEISRTEHDKRSLAVVIADLLKLKLVDLFGQGVRQMGLDNSVGFSPYPVTQQLAWDLYEHKDAPDGILYASRLGGPHRAAVVFFDRAKPHLRLFPGLVPTPLPQLREAFDALTQVHKIALL